MELGYIAQDILVYFITFLTSQVRCYYIIVLLNVILTIVQLSGFFSKNNTCKIENLEKKALRFIKMNFNSSYTLLLDDCNKCPLYHGMYVVRIKRFVELVYKVAHDKCPIYLNDWITEKYTRSQNDMYIPQYKTITYGKHTFIYQAPYYWNKLPNLITNAHNFNVFKPLLRERTPICARGSCLV